MTDAGHGNLQGRGRVPGVEHLLTRGSYPSAMRFRARRCDLGAGMSAEDLSPSWHSRMGPGMMTRPRVLLRPGAFLVNVPGRLSCLCHLSPLEALVIVADPQETRAAVGAMLTEAAAVGRLVEAGAGLRYEAPTSGLREARSDASARRTSRLYNDPTADLATNTRRLRLAAALDEAGLSLQEGTERLRRARRGLERALREAHDVEVLGAAA